MENYLGQLTNEIFDSGLGQKGIEGLPDPSHLLMGVFVTLLPKLVPRLMPFFFLGQPQQVRERFSDPDFYTENEELFRSKFTEYMRMLEDVVIKAEDGSFERDRKEFTGTKKFFFGLLEALDVDVSDYVGGLEVESVREVARISSGEDSMSGLYNMIADSIMTLGGVLINYLGLN